MNLVLNILVILLVLSKNQYTKVLFCFQNNNPLSNILTMKERKRALRAHIKDCRAEFSAEQLAEMSARAMARIEGLEAFRKASTVALYWSLAGETSTHDLVRKYAATKRIVLPVVDGETMHFAEVAADCSNLTSGAFGVMEPRESTECPPDEIELMIVPGVAFDCRGGRMGHGKGYYDKYFEHYNGLKIGVCFDFQMVGEVPCEPFDVRMNAVLTEKEYICDL